MANSENREALARAQHPQFSSEERDPEVARKAQLLRERDARDAVRRRNEQALASRQRTIDLLTRISLISAAAVLGALAFRIAMDRSRSTEEASKQLAPHARIIEAAGLQRETTSLLRKGKVEASAQVEGCFAVVGARTSGPAPIELSAGGQRIQATGVAYGCGCGPIKLSASVDGKDEQAALSIYQGASLALGGVRGLRKKLAGVAELDLSAGCAERELDTWLATRGAASARAAAEKAAGPVVEALLRRGMRVAGHSTQPSADPIPFSLAPDECGLVLASGATLRGAEGAAWAQGADAGIAFCGAPPAVNAVLTQSPQGALVMAARLADQGGVLPLIDAARLAGVKGPIRASLAPASTETAARRLLELVTPQVAPVRTLGAAPELRIVSIARSQTARAASVGALLCDPPLDEGVPQALCVLPPGKDLHLTEDLTAFSAPAPVWLRALERASAPAAHARALQLLRVARLLRVEGFDPTLLEGSRELPGASEVTGRAGEDRVVVVDLSPRPPYVVPLSDGPRWTLDGAPRVIPLAPGAKRTFRDPQLSASPPSERRTVVFRGPARSRP